MYLVESLNGKASSRGLRASARRDESARYVYGAISRGHIQQLLFQLLHSQRAESLLLSHISFKVDLVLPPLLGAQDQRLGVEQNQLPCGSTGTSSGNCQERETCMVRACHTPRQPLQIQPSGRLERWATPWSAEEMLLKEWTCLSMPELLTMASCRKHWKTISAESSVLSP